MSKFIDDLRDAHDHLDRALEHHEAGRHHAVRYRIGLARACVQRAIDAAYIEPTHDVSGQGGAQGSAGQVDGSSDGRGFDAESIRLRDQRRAVDHAYRARLAQMGGRR